MKKPTPHPKTKRKTTFTRRKFIGSCAAGASLLNVAPFISFPHSNLFEPSFLQDPIKKDKIFHPLDPKWTDSEDQPTIPIINSSYSDYQVTTIVHFRGFFSFEKFLTVKNPIDPVNRQQQFHYLSIENMGWVNQSGKPELPYLALLFHIPKFLDYELEDIPPGFELNTNPDGEPLLFHQFPDLMVYPSQAELFDNVGSSKSYSKTVEYDETVYGMDKRSPEFVVEEGGSFDFGYSRIVIVKIRPLLFNPKYQNPDTGEVGPMVFGYSKVPIRFKLSKKSRIHNEYRLETPYLPTELDPLPRHERIIDPWHCRKKVGQILDGFVGNEVSDYKQFGPDLLIIHPKNYFLGSKPIDPQETDPIDDLKEHKKKHGFPFAESIPYSQLENTINLIRYRRTVDTDTELIPWPRMRHVILFGDENEIPSFSMNRILEVKHSQNDYFYSRFHPRPEESNRRLEKKISSDYYNGTLTNRNTLEDIVVSDITVGRIPIKTLHEANMVVANIKDYDTHDYNIQKNVTLVSYFQDIGPGSREFDGEASTDYLQTMERIRERLHQSIRVNTIYQNQNKDHASIQLYYRDGSEVDNAVPFLNSSDSKAAILEAFRSGERIIVHRDHGYMDGWSRPNFKIPDTWEITPDVNPSSPATKPSIVFSMNCLSGHFMGEKSLKLPKPYNDCFSEALVIGVDLPDGTKLNLNCPAVIAAVDESPTFHNDWLIKAIFDGIYGGIISTRTDDMENVSKVRIGNVLNLAKMLLFTSIEETGLNMYENEIYHLLGDPTLLI